jgi:hypothetical protein
MATCRKTSSLPSNMATDWILRTSLFLGRPRADAPWSFAPAALK